MGIIKNKFKLYRIIDTVAGWGAAGGDGRVERRDGLIPGTRPERSASLRIVSAARQRRPVGFISVAAAGQVGRRQTAEISDRVVPRTDDQWAHGQPDGCRRRLFRQLSGGRLVVLVDDKIIRRIRLIKSLKNAGAAGIVGQLVIVLLFRRQNQSGSVPADQIVQQFRRAAGRRIHHPVSSCWTRRR